MAGPFVSSLDASARVFKADSKYLVRQVCPDYRLTTSLGRWLLVKKLNSLFASIIVKLKTLFSAVEALQALVVARNHL